MAARKPPTPTPFESAAHPPARPGSEATKIEQSRAVAEVQGAIVLAQQRPRDIARAKHEMEMACNEIALADRAFYRYMRGKVITGSSVQLARELARCWGNIDYGVKELERDDFAGRSEMLAFSWDLETNTRSELTFIVPHRRDTNAGGVDLTSLRDIYENNANAGARRLRETIYAVLPVWFRTAAEDLCHETIKAADDKTPIAERVANAIKAFAAIKVTPAMLEAKLGKKTDAFDAEDLATLRVVRRALKNGETTIEEEFEGAAPARPTGTGDAFERAAAGETKPKAAAAGVPAAAATDAPATSASPESSGDAGASASPSDAARASDAMMGAAHATNGPANATAVAHAPKSPLKGGDWPTWTDWAIDELRKLPDGEARTDFVMGRFGKEFDAMREIRRADWARVKPMLPA